MPINDQSQVNEADDSPRPFRAETSRVIGLGEKLEHWKEFAPQVVKLEIRLLPLPVDLEPAKTTARHHLQRSIALARRLDSSRFLNTLPRTEYSLDR